jgi:two-component system, NarL family, sensor histidine kinase DesK
MSTKAITEFERRGRAWIWIAYTGFLFVQPILEPSLRQWLGTLAIFALYLCIYTVYDRSIDNNRHLRYWMIAATFVLGLITYPWNSGASTFFIYTAAFLPFNMTSVRRIVTLFIAESLLISAETALFHPHINWISTFIAIFLLLTVGSGNIFFSQQRRTNLKLHAALEENIALAAVAERERIARDLHDVLGHTLSVIVLKAELAGRLVERDPQRATAEIGDVERTARTALAEVREAIGGYRARGLAAEIETARRALDAAGVTLTVENDMGSARLAATEETVLALALREAVTNIVRHAQAKHCRLRFISEDGHQRLLVEDDGEHTVAREGNGLRGMRERIEALGGNMRLERESGTRLFIELPLRTEGATS